MLSVLIPVYNCDIRKLVSDLDNQCKDTSIQYEIIVYDDASNTKFKQTNQDINQMDAIIYKELETNIGRAAIRNKLAFTAKYGFLLFLDCDSVVRPGFIFNYVQMDLKSPVVICGGRKYPSVPPNDKQFILHWKYGNQKESMDVQKRKRNGYKSFMTNNFVISKEVFNTIRFHEGITTYGHEDTLFGLELKANHIPIIHINNPVIHAGLETNHAFLKKTETAIQNLKKIETKNEINKNVNLLRWEYVLNYCKLKWLISFIFSVMRQWMIKNLTGKNPSLYIFDFYKLGYLVSIKKKADL